MDPLSISASIVALSTLGLKTAYGIINYADSTKGAGKTLKRIADDVYVTVGVLGQLRDLLGPEKGKEEGKEGKDTSGKEGKGNEETEDKQEPGKQPEGKGNEDKDDKVTTDSEKQAPAQTSKPTEANSKPKPKFKSIFNDKGLRDTQSAITAVEDCFKDIELELSKASKSIRDDKATSTSTSTSSSTSTTSAFATIVKAARFRKREAALFPFRKERIEELRSELRHAKGNLMLMLAVASLAHQDRLAREGEEVREEERRRLVKEVALLKRMRDRPVEDKQANRPERPPPYQKESPIMVGMTMMPDQLLPPVVEGGVLSPPSQGIATPPTPTMDTASTPGPAQEDSVQEPQQGQAAAPALPVSPTDDATLDFRSTGPPDLMDYQAQLMLLEAQNKRRLQMARQEQEQNGQAKQSHLANPAPSNPAPPNSAAEDQQNSEPIDQLAGLDVPQSLPLPSVDSLATPKRKAVLNAPQAAAYLASPSEHTGKVSIASILAEPSAEAEGGTSTSATADVEISAGSSGGPPAPPDNHTLQAYQEQLLQLEEQGKRRCQQAREEQDRMAKAWVDSGKGKGNISADGLPRVDSGDRGKAAVSIPEAIAKPVNVNPCDQIMWSCTEGGRDPSSIGADMDPNNPEERKLDDVKPRTDASIVAAINQSLGKTFSVPFSPKREKHLSSEEEPDLPAASVSPFRFPAITDPEKFKQVRFDPKIPHSRPAPPFRAADYHWPPKPTNPSSFPATTAGQSMTGPAPPLSSTTGPTGQDRGLFGPSGGSSEQSIFTNLFSNPGQSSQNHGLQGNLFSGQFDGSKPMLYPLPHISNLVPSKEVKDFLPSRPGVRGRYGEPDYCSTTKGQQSITLDPVDKSLNEWAINRSFEEYELRRWKMKPYPVGVRFAGCWPPFGLTMAEAQAAMAHEDEVQQREKKERAEFAKLTAAGLPLFPPPPADWYKSKLPEAGDASSSSQGPFATTGQGTTSASWQQPNFSGPNPSRDSQDGRQPGWQPGWPPNTPWLNQQPSSERPNQASEPISNMHLDAWALIPRVTTLNLSVHISLAIEALPLSHSEIQAKVTSERANGSLWDRLAELTPQEYDTIMNHVRKRQANILALVNAAKVFLNSGFGTVEAKRITFITETPVPEQSHAQFQPQLAQAPFSSSYVPTYCKVNLKHIDIATVEYYQLPWEVDKDDPSYIIILQELDDTETDVLFEHTRRSREEKAAQAEKPPPASQPTFWVGPYTGHSSKTKKSSFTSNSLFGQAQQPPRAPRPASSGMNLADATSAPLHPASQPGFGTSMSRPVAFGQAGPARHSVFGQSALDGPRFMSAASKTIPQGNVKSVDVAVPRDACPSFYRGNSDDPAAYTSTLSPMPPMRTDRNPVDDTKEIEDIADDVSWNTDLHYQALDPPYSSSSEQEEGAGGGSEMRESRRQKRAEWMEADKRRQKGVYERRRQARKQREELRKMNILRERMRAEFLIKKDRSRSTTVTRSGITPPHANHTLSLLDSKSFGNQPAVPGSSSRDKPRNVPDPKDTLLEARMKQFQLQREAQRAKSASPHPGMPPRQHSAPALSAISGPSQPFGWGQPTSYTMTRCGAEQSTSWSGFAPPLPVEPEKFKAIPKADKHMPAFELPDETWGLTVVPGLQSAGAVSAQEIVTTRQESSRRHTPTRLSDVPETSESEGELAELARRRRRRAGTDFIKKGERPLYPPRLSSDALVERDFIQVEKRAVEVNSLDDEEPKLTERGEGPLPHPTPRNRPEIVAVRVRDRDAGYDIAHDVLETDSDSWESSRGESSPKKEPTMADLSADTPPIFINAKQFHRIIKRRQERGDLQRRIAGQESDPAPAEPVEDKTGGPPGGRRLFATTSSSGRTRAKSGFSLSSQQSDSIISKSDRRGQVFFIEDPATRKGKEPLVEVEEPSEMESNPDASTTTDDQDLLTNFDFDSFLHPHESDPGPSEVKEPGPVWDYLEKVREAEEHRIKIRRELVRQQREMIERTEREARERDELREKLEDSPKAPDVPSTDGQRRLGKEALMEPSHAVEKDTNRAKLKLDNCERSQGLGLEPGKAVQFLDSSNEQGHVVDKAHGGGSETTDDAVDLVALMNRAQRENAVTFDHDDDTVESEQTDETEEGSDTSLEDEDLVRQLLNEWTNVDGDGEEIELAREDRVVNPGIDGQQEASAKDQETDGQGAGQIAENASQGLEGHETRSSLEDRDDVGKIASEEDKIAEDRNAAGSDDAVNRQGGFEIYYVM